MASEVASDPTQVPGKEFLHSLHRRLNGERRNGEERGLGAVPGPPLDWTAYQPLIVNTACLSYLQKLLFAMLTQLKSGDSKLVTQWRLNAAVARQLETGPASTATMGVASPGRLLQLAGRLLEVDTVLLTALHADSGFSLPSECSLSVFPKLSRLHLSGVDLESVSGLNSVADMITDLHYSNFPLTTLASLLHRRDPLPSKWRSLRTLSVQDSKLAQVDANVIAQALNLESVAFCNNHLESFAALVQCKWLSVINLSNNRLHTIDIPAGAFEHVKLLNLSHNCISSVARFHGCRNVEVLDLKSNLIKMIDELCALKGLQRLRAIKLGDNPVSKLSSHRDSIRQLLSDQVILDGAPWETSTLQSELDSGVSTVVVLDATNGSQSDRMFASPLKRRSVSSGIWRSCLAIGAAQLIVSILWGLDVETTRLTLWIIMIAAAFGGVAFLLDLATSRLCTIDRRRFSKDGEERSQSPSLSNAIHSSTFRTLSRGLSMQPTMQQTERMCADAEKGIRVDELELILSVATIAGDNLSVSQLVKICRHLQIFLAQLSVYHEATLGFAWSRLSRALSSLDLPQGALGTDERVRRQLSSHMTLLLESVEPSTSFAASLPKILSVLRMCAILLRSVSTERDASMAHVLRMAYSDAFGSEHKWWRQQSVLSSLAGNSTTETLLDWLSSSQPHSHHRIVEAARACGVHLLVLHSRLVEMVDEHTHSFGHHFHPNS